MIKTKIIETTEKYDKDGKLVEKFTREETSEDDTNYSGNKTNKMKEESICDSVLNEMKERERRFGHSLFMF